MSIVDLSSRSRKKRRNEASKAPVYCALHATFGGKEKVREPPLVHPLVARIQNQIGKRLFQPTLEKRLQRHASCAVASLNVEVEKL